MCLSTIEREREREREREISRMVKVPDERPNGYAIHASVWTVISIWPSSVKVVRLWNERKGGWEDGNLERERERERERDFIREQRQ